MKRSHVRLVVRAFTLVELMVSLAVMMVLTTVLLWHYPETAVRLTVSNASHTTALMIREAQVRGSAIDSVNSSVGGYGTYFSLSQPDKLILFGDLVTSGVGPYGVAIGDGLFQSSSPDETKTVITLPARYVVSKLCVGAGFPFTCNSANNPSITSLTVSFTRPNPTPSIYVNNLPTTNYSAGCIELRSPNAPAFGHVRAVQVFNSGMITTTIGKCDNSSQ